MMSITRNQQLTCQQLEELNLLCADCKATDCNIVAIYKHLLSQNRPTSCNLLYYHRKQLIGFLSTFFFYEDACEVPLMVAPAFRKQGIAKRMLREILPLIATDRIKSLLFSSPNGLNDPWLLTRGFNYQSSEYQMQKWQNERMVERNNSLVIRLATPADLPAICAIDGACFQQTLDDMSIRLHTLLHEPNYSVFIALKEGEPIGKAHIHLTSDGARLSDIAIIPPFQGQGLGTAVLTHCINYCLTAKQSNIVLDVETNNQLALRLYTRLGFVISNAYDFWSIPVKKLR